MELQSLGTLINRVLHPGALRGLDTTFGNLINRTLHPGVVCVTARGGLCNLADGDGLASRARKQKNCARGGIGVFVTVKREFPSEIGKRDNET